METTRTQQLSAAGVSIWLDDLSRSALQSGELRKVIKERNVVGVTTNPTIFAKALSQGDAYASQVQELAASGATVSDAVFSITTNDVADAADIFRPIYEETGGFDGRVSIEVAPDLAHDVDGTMRQATMLWERLARPNVMIKIPATLEGLEAITAAVSAGISVNVTLIFSLERYRQVINAYLTGLENAKAAGKDLSQIHSVASFFVSRVDTEIDKRLTAIGTPGALTLKGRAGVANAQLAYEIFEETFDSTRAHVLLAAGANKQRPLWASTGVKDPAYSDTLYVDQLVAPNVVNTMPHQTLEAAFDHAEIDETIVTRSYETANGVLNAIGDLGISYRDVTEQLEQEGVDKFIVSWNELLHTIETELEAAR